MPKARIDLRGKVIHTVLRQNFSPNPDFRAKRVLFTLAFKSLPYIILLRAKYFREARISSN